MVIRIQVNLNLGIPGILATFFDKLITKHLYEKHTKFICVSKSLQKCLRKINIKESNIIVIPNGVDTFLFSRNESSKSLKIKSNDKAKNIAFVGRLCVQKGLKYFLKAIPLVMKEYKEANFFILGNGPLEKKIKKLACKLRIQSKITFLDFIPLERMPEFYSAMDIFCLPTLYEGFPLTIAEALAMGLVIVASAVDGIPDAITENKNGFLVEPRNSLQLAKILIKSLCLNEMEINQICENNIQLAKKTYSWTIITNKIITIYKSSL